MSSPELYQWDKTQCLWARMMAIVSASEEAEAELAWKWESLLSVVQELAF